MRPSLMRSALPRACTEPCLHKHLAVQRSRPRGSPQCTGTGRGQREACRGRQRPHHECPVPLGQPTQQCFSKRAPRPRSGLRSHRSRLRGSLFPTCPRVAQTPGFEPAHMGPRAGPQGGDWFTIPCHQWLVTAKLVSGTHVPPTGSTGTAGKRSPTELGEPRPRGQPKLAGGDPARVRLTQSPLTAGPRDVMRIWLSSSGPLGLLHLGTATEWRPWAGCVGPG